jgi:hypothetical protein
MGYACLTVTCLFHHSLVPQIDGKIFVWNNLASVKISSTRSPIWPSLGVNVFPKKFWWIHVCKPDAQGCTIFVHIVDPEFRTKTPGPGCQIRTRGLSSKFWQMYTMKWNVWNALKEKNSNNGDMPHTGHVISHWRKRNIQTAETNTIMKEF